jgi:hypothetical protein
MVVSLSYITGINFMESNLGAYEIAGEALVFEIVAVGIAVLLDYRQHRFRINGSD